jgi:hypothetical protein
MTEQTPLFAMPLKQVLKKIKWNSRENEASAVDAIALFTGLTFKQSEAKFKEICVSHSDLREKVTDHQGRSFCGILTLLCILLCCEGPTVARLQEKVAMFSLRLQVKDLSAHESLLNAIANQGNLDFIL